MKMNVIIFVPLLVSQPHLFHSDGLEFQCQICSRETKSRVELRQTRPSRIANRGALIVRNEVEYI